MRAVAGAVGVVLGLAIVGAAAYLVLPRVMPGAVAARPGPGSPTEEPPVAASGAPRPSAPLSAPSTEAERLRQELSERRVPFYRALRRDWPDLVERFAVLDELDTLDLVVSRDDDAALSTFLSRGIAPAARDYGFRRVRFMVRTPVGSAASFRTVAEATSDADNHWTLYRK